MPLPYKRKYLQKNEENKKKELTRSERKQGRHNGHIEALSSRSKHEIRQQYFTI